MEHTPKEEEIREEFQKWLSAETTFAYGIPDDRTIADYWLRIRREAIAEEREKFINFILSEEIEMQVGDNINELLEYRGIEDCGKSMRAGTKDKILQPLANRIKRNFSHLTQEEETKKAKYVLDGRKPYWELPDGTRESYTHQDGNYSNQCACEYCRCNQ